jgi:hypothetical protein
MMNHDQQRMSMGRSAWAMLALLGGLMATPLAQAANVQCTTADKSVWLPPTEVKRMLEQHGFANVGQVRPDDGNCYVVQATDDAGAKRTLYLDPTDGALRAME